MSVTTSTGFDGIGFSHEHSRRTITRITNRFMHLFQWWLVYNGFVLLVAPASFVEFVSSSQVNQNEVHQQCEVGNDGTCLDLQQKALLTTTSTQYYINTDGQVIVDDNDFSGWKSYLLRKNQSYSKVVNDDSIQSMLHSDPNMKRMPDVDFDAYVRADINSYYQDQTGTRDEKDPMYDGQAGKFINMTPKKTSLYYVSGSTGLGEPKIIADIEKWGSGGTATFPFHKFILTHYREPDKVICRFKVEEGISVNYCNPYMTDSVGVTSNTTYKSSVPGEVVLTGNTVWKLNSLSKGDRIKYNAHLYNLEFGDKYEEFTGGSPWLTMYPPNKLPHWIWPAEYFEQEHTIVTNETHFHTIPTNVSSDVLTIDQMRNPPTSLLQPYRNPGMMNITIKVVSCTPRAFEIQNFLSETEVDHIIARVEKLSLERSTTGGHVSSTRTSRTTWLGRDVDYIMNAIYRRVADAVRIHEALLRRRVKKEVPIIHDLLKINEEMQIVHYDPNQEYTAHHDFGYPTGVDPINKLSRSLNFAFYLNDVVEGGETSFPRWRNSETRGQLKIKPEKGKALLFYMVNPDGNLEDLSQHAGLPVIRGEKYFANLWLHTYIPK